MKPDTDDYSTCAEAYATLRLYHPEARPEVATSALGVEPTEVQHVGDTYESSNRIRTKKLNGWFLSSEAAVSSFDISKHIDYILSSLSGKEPVLTRLKAEGWRADIACMWDSAYGHGGPTLAPEMLRRLANLGVELWFDIYFHGTYQLLEKEKNAFGGR
jgi:hypothetical protein